jgi:hypothetical protein
MGRVASRPIRGVRHTGVYIPIEDFALLQRAAAMKRMPINSLLLELLAPGFAELRANPPTRDEDDA